MWLSPLPDDEHPSPAGPTAPVLPPGVVLAGLVEVVPITAGLARLLGVVIVAGGVFVVAVVVAAVVVVAVVVVVVVAAVIVVAVIAVVVVVIAVVVVLGHGG